MMPKAGKHPTCPNRIYCHMEDWYGWNILIWNLNPGPLN